MAKVPRIAWDSTCFVAWVDRGDTEDPAALKALEVTMERMIAGRLRLVASKAIEIEVRPGLPDHTRRFHDQLRACPHFESFDEGPTIRDLARELADRVQASGRRAGYADLIHVATAIAARATEFWTTDRKMLNWFAEGVITEIRICRPYLVQGVLEL